MEKYIPVVVIKELSETDKILTALKSSGINTAEITFRTACAAEAIAYACEKYPEMNIGAGTVINAEQCEAALAAGAKFIVSPGLSVAVAKTCKLRGVPYYPGCVTPTEIMAALELGITTVKFFPANVYGGLKAMKALSAPFPQIKFIPTGGVDRSNIDEFLAWDKIAAIGGSFFVKEALEKNGGINNMHNAKYDIIVQGGQSNADGTGRGPVSRELSVSPNAWYLEAEKTITIGEDNLYVTYADKPFQIIPAQERMVDGQITGDFSLTFAEEYEKAGLLQADRKLLIIRGAIGGAGFKKKHWGLGNVLYNKLIEMVDYALSLNVENRIVGFLWHQGEHDAFEGNTPEAYKAQFSAQLRDFRARYGENIPFIAGDFVREWRSQNEESCRPIVQKIRDVVAEEGNGEFVETSDLLSNNEQIQDGDVIHFSRESLHILGARYFQAFQTVKNKQKR